MWMYIITRNTVTDYFRIRRSMAAFEDYMLEEAPAMDLTVDAPDNRADALMSLKENECGLIVLHNYTRNTLKTVTEMMEISNINAKVIHKKALTSLQAFYAAG